MSSELVAGLTGGALALVAGLLTQWVAARQSLRRRRLELAAHLLASLKSTQYFLDAHRHQQTIETGSAVVAVQHDLVAYSYELQPIAPRRLAKSIQVVIHGALFNLSHISSADPRQWAAGREAFNQVVDEYDYAVQKYLHGKRDAR